MSKQQDQFSSQYPIGDAPSLAPGSAMRIIGIICIFCGIAVFIFIAIENRIYDHKFAAYAIPSLLFAILGAIIFVGGEIKRALFDIVTPPFLDEDKNP